MRDGIEVGAPVPRVARSIHQPILLFLTSGCAPCATLISAMTAFPWPDDVHAVFLDREHGSSEEAIAGIPGSHLTTGALAEDIVSSFRLASSPVAYLLVDGLIAAKGLVNEPGHLAAFRRELVKQS